MNVMKTALLIVALASAVTAEGRPPQAPQTAGVSLESRSIRLGVGASESFSVVLGGAGARSFGNGELRPSSARPGFYEANYVIIENAAPMRRVESGIIYVAVPATDTDSDTVPDIADLSAAVDVTLEAEAVPAGNAGLRISKADFSIHLVRAAGSETGEFTTDIIAAEEVGGSYAVLHMEGLVEYRRTDGGALLDFSISESPTNALATARVVDGNTVRVAPFRLQLSQARRIRVGPATLTRTENFYRGEVLLSDGWEETAVPDYRSWVMQIQDRNDLNGNDVSDFSDVLAPYVAVHPRRVITAQGETISFAVVVTGTGPFSFQWQQNGHGLSSTAANGTNRVLVLPNVTTDDAGSYRVLVTNAGGSVFSESTSLTVRSNTLR